jgi:hypothetical protein
VAFKASCKAAVSSATPSPTAPKELTSKARASGGRVEKIESSMERVERELPTEAVMKQSRANNDKGIDRMKQ